MTAVLVVGAGPTGLTLGLDLLRRGIACRIVDRAPAPADTSRAIAIHSRTLEVLEALEVTHELVARGNKAHGSSVWAEGKRVVHVSFDELETPFPYVLCISQTETEAVLRAALERAGGRIDWGTELLSVTQDRDAAHVRLRHRDGTEEALAYSWVVGCDGAHSVVRKNLGVAFEGAAYEQGFILADGQLDSSLPEDEINAFLSDDGPLLLVPLGFARWRIVAATRPAKSPEERPPEPTLAEVQSLLDERVGKARLTEARWIARFRIHHRLVPDYRSQRVFLAGDAAHIHSPVGGQGMNAGMQDARNLAWKLALVAQGHARDGLLDTYHLERRAVAEAIVQGTDRATRVATLRNPIGRALRDSLGTFLVGLDVVQHRLTREAAGIALNYRKSPIVAEDRPGVLGVSLRAHADSERPSVLEWLDFGAAPRAGERAPDAIAQDARTSLPVRVLELLRDPRHQLLLFDGRAGTAEGYAHLVRVGDEVHRRFDRTVRVHLVVPHDRPPAGLQWDGSLLLDPDEKVHRRYGAGSECLYLIRPDGYVGYRSQPADRERLRRYLDGLFT